MAKGKNNFQSVFTDILYNAMGVSKARINTDDHLWGNTVSEPNRFNSLNYFKSFMQSGVNLSALYNLYDQMDANSEDVVNVLDIFSEEAAFRDLQTKKIIWATSKTNPTVANKINEMIDRLRLNEKAFDYLRRIAKYGRWVVRPNYVKVTINDKDRVQVGWLDDQLNTDMVMDQEKHYNRRIVSSYSIDGAWTGYNITNGVTTNFGQEADFRFWDFIEFKLGETLYGRSFLLDLADKWKALDAMEKALELFRTVRSPQLNIYKVPVGSSDPTMVIRTLKLYKNYIEAQVNRTQDGAGDPRFSQRIPTPLESLFIPTNADGTGGDVDVITQTADVRDIRDIEYKRGKFLSALYSVIDFDGISSISDPSKPVSAQSIRVLKKTQRLQEAFLVGVRQLAYIELALSGIEVDKSDFDLNMNVPSDIMETIRLEKLNFATDAATQLFDIGDRIVGEEESKDWSTFVVEQFLEDHFGDLMTDYKKYKAAKADQENQEDATINSEGEKGGESSWLRESSITKVSSDWTTSVARSILDHFNRKLVVLTEDVEEREADVDSTGNVLLEASAVYEMLKAVEYEGIKLEN